MSYFSSTDRFLSSKSNDFTGPGGHIKPLKFQHINKKFQQLSTMVYEHAKDEQEIEEKNKLYKMMSGIKKNSQTLPQNIRQPQGDRASHLYLSFSHKYATEYLVHKPKGCRLGPGWYQKSLHQQKQLKSQSDFSIRGKSEFQKSIQQRVRQDSLDSSHQRSICSLSNHSTVKTLSRRKYSLLNLSLSNVKDNDDFLFGTGKDSVRTANGAKTERKAFTLQDYSQSARQTNGFSGGETFSEGGFHLPKKLYFNGEDSNDSSFNKNKISNFNSCSRNDHTAATSAAKIDQKEKLNLINQQEDSQCNATQEELDEYVQNI